MINIDLKLFATLTKYSPEDQQDIQVEEGCTVQDLIDTLKIPDEQVKLIFINSKKQTRQTVLTDNDRLGLFPPVGGG